jgi:TM2 domain-containing membrane protein YozV
MNLACPHCRGALSVDPSQAGSTTACPRCGGKFHVPLPVAHLGGDSISSPIAHDTEYAAFVSKRIPAGIFGILLGCLGIHKFILRFNTAGCIMLAVSFFGVCLFCIPTLLMMLFGIVEGIIYFVTTDDAFYRRYAIEKREWL